MSKRFDDAEEFIRIWQTSKSIIEVCKRVGHKRGVVVQRATRYRRQGVRLKHFESIGEAHGTRAKNVRQWKRLAELAESLL